MYASEVKKQINSAKLIQDTEKQLIVKIREYEICFWKQDKNRILIHSSFPNKTFLDVTLETIEDLIKLLTQLHIIK
jgi:hypothetical protein